MDTLTVNGNGNAPELSFSTRLAILATGTTLDLSKLVENPHNLPITYEVDNQYQWYASVDDKGVVTANGEPYALVYVKTVGSLTYGSGKAAIEPIP